MCLIVVAHVLWQLGYPDQAVKRSHEAVSLAQELSHPFSLAFALYNAAVLHQFRREGQLTQERAEALMALAREQEFPLWLAWGTVLQGWVVAEQGHREESSAQMRQGMAAMRATGAELYRTHDLALLAEVYGGMGQAEEGLAVLTEALAMADKGGERFYEAELYRLKGTLTLQLFNVQGAQGKIATPQAEAEAAACFHKALEIARRQSAKSLELRAAVSLSRLWQQQGKTDEARQMLTEIYGWFTEGFDTDDLQAAKALLEELHERR